MSSHHIVRDDQEPALILNHPSPDDRVVLQLMEWSPLLVCLPLSFWFVEEKQQWVDYLVKDGNSFPVSIPSELIEFPSEYPSDILNYSIDFLIEKGHEIIHIYSELSNEAMLELVQQYATIEIIFFDGQARHIPCVEGRFEKWYPAGQKVKSFPVLEGLQGGEGWQDLKSDGFLKLNSSRPFLLSEFLNIND